MSHPDSWTTAEVINVIEDTLTLPAAEVTAVVEAAARIDLDGPLLVTFISEADVHHLLTKHVGLTDSLQRLKLISKVRARIKLATAAATTTIENEFKGERERGHRMMAGEKSIAAPTLPAPPTGEQLPTYKQWQSKMKGYKGWCQLEDKSFAKIIDMMMVGNLSLDRLQGIKGQMTSKQLRMDSVLGVQLFNTMPEGLEKQFAKKNNYEMDGETSGMQMIGFINDKINKQSDARFDSLMAELADRQPIGHLSDLQAEISEIRRLQETIAHQGVSIPSWQLVPIIKKAVKTLVQDKELTLAFGTPFTVAMSSCWLKPLPSAAIFVTRSELVPLHWCCIHLVELISKKWSNTGASRSKPAAIGASAYAVFMQATATGSSVTIIRQSAAAVCNSLKLGWYLIAAASQRS